VTARAAGNRENRGRDSGRDSSRDSGRVWIAWETQRRSLNLSRRVGAELVILDLDRLGRWRYLVSIVKTVKVLFAYRGKTVFVQNPSMILATLACLLKPVFRYVLVVDRHTAYMDARSGGPPKQRLMRALSIFTLRHASLTIVTNSQLVRKVKLCGGRGAILPDPSPELEVAPRRNHSGPFEILLVSSWAPDEPIAAVAEAGRLLGPGFRIWASGNPKTRFANVLAGKPENFNPTGFLPDSEYFDLMRRVDCVAALTTRGATLVCGAYEAISLGKPVVLGNSKVLRDYFSSGAVYSDCTAPDLAQKISRIAREYDVFHREILVFREKSRADWEKSLQQVEDCILHLSGVKIV
jgi:glycosyltransferase involved in cell wall biosynthesis